MTYHPIRRWLHWIVALLVIGLVPAGLVIAGYDPAMVKKVDGLLGKGGFDLIYALHKSAGLTVLGLMILRVVARATYPAPDYHPPLTPFERRASTAVHLLLYALLIVTPIIGWIGVSAYPAPAPFWFLFDAKLPIPANRALSETLLQDVHGPLGLLIGVLALVHIAAAFKHLLVNRDGVMRRMLG